MGLRTPLAVRFDPCAVLPHQARHCQVHLRHLQAITNPYILYCCYFSCSYTVEYATSK